MLTSNKHYNQYQPLHQKLKQTTTKKERNRSGDDDGDDDDDDRSGLAHAACAKIPMNTNQSQHQFSPSQNTHHLQPIQPKPQPIQATAPPLKHQLPPELKPKLLKRERQLKPKTNLKHNLHRDPQTQSPP